MLLTYRYEMDLEFTQPVTDQYFSVMCIPRETERQKPVSISVFTDPDTHAGMDTDGLGNPFVYGVIHEPHSSFRLVSEGTTEQTGSLHEEYEDPDAPGMTRYRVQSAFTQPGPALSGLYRKWIKTAPADDYGRMLHFGNCVQEELSYVSGSTGVDTTAEQAAEAGTGVCQDYAHVMIALLRMSGIPARYVTGMMSGEGQTHAWVEANCLGYWYGIDPTNNALADSSYIKFSHGRDYQDCMISRGIFTNPFARQSTDVNVIVRQLSQ